MGSLRSSIAVSLACAYVALASHALAQGEKKRGPLPIEVVAGLKWFNPDFDVTADGQWLAYTYQFEPTDKKPATDPAAPMAEGYTGIRATNRKTGKVIQVSREEVNSRSPVWSPDGSRIAFFVGDWTKAELWIWDRSSGSSTAIPGLAVQAGAKVQWLADSTQLVFTTPFSEETTEPKPPPVVAEPKTPGPNVLVQKSGRLVDASVPSAQPMQVPPVSMTKTQLALLKLGSGSPETIDTGSTINWYGLSPDGRYLAYAIMRTADAKSAEAHQDLVFYDWKTKTRIVRHEPKPGYIWSWSPNSRELAYLTRDAPQGARPINAELIIASVSGDTERNLGDCDIPLIKNYSPPLWNEEGTDIYLLGTNEDVKDIDYWYMKAHDQLWRVNIRSGHGALVGNIPGKQIDSILAYDASSVAFSNDAYRSVWVMAREATRGWGFGSGLYRVDLSSGEAQLTLAAGSRLSRSFRVNKSTGDIIYVGTDHKRPEDIWSFNPVRNVKRQLSRLNPELSAYELGDAKLIEYTDSAGRELRGALLLPPGYRKERRLPLVVWIYGHASDADYINSFGFMGARPSHNLHVLATRGYAVLLPDAPLRAGMQMEDVLSVTMSGVDTLIEQGYVDPTRLALMGQSFGSYCVLALIAQTHRFKAAVASGVSIFPDLSFIYQIILAEGKTPELESDDRYGSNLALGGTPWQYPDRYRNNSPFYRFDTIGTPFLMAQGRKDGTGASNIIFHSLKRLNKDVEYLLYENDDHSISLAPNVIDFWQRRIAFLDKHLNISRRPNGEIELETGR